MEITRTGATTLSPANDRTLEPRKPEDAPKATAEASAKDQAKATEEPSNLKSFAYGALDLDKPEEQAEETDSAYTAGKWLGAAAKVGGIISLLI